jgi:hypothetical protein
MFVRFRQTKRRLQASLIETSRVGGKVRHEHVGSLGSLPCEPTVQDRFAFWTALRPRLDRLANRIGAEGEAAIIAALTARIPAPTAEEAMMPDLGKRTRVDRRYDAMLSEIIAHGGKEMAGRVLNDEVKLAERRTIRLVWDYLQILKRQHAQEGHGPAK